MKSYNQFVSEAYQAKQSLDENVLKFAARAIPGLQTAYGLGLGGYRLYKGDPVGAGLAFASAVPGPIGWGALAADVGREFGLGKGTPFGKPEARVAKPSKSGGSPSDDSQFGKTGADGKVWAGKDYGWQNPQTVWRKSGAGTAIGQEKKLPGSLGTKYWTGKEYGWQSKATIEKKAKESKAQTPQQPSAPPQATQTPQQPSTPSQATQPSQQPSRPPETPQAQQLAQEPLKPYKVSQSSQQSVETSRPSNAKRDSKNEGQMAIAKASK